MQDKLHHHLIQYGLSESQATIYLAVLQYGNVSVSKIARLTGIKRVTVYMHINEMVSQGRLTESVVGGVRHYATIDPTQIHAKWKASLDAFEGLLPTFLALADTRGNKPVVQYFEGVQGLKSLYADLLRSSGEVCSFLGGHTINQELLTYLYDEFLPERVAKGITARVITAPSEFADEYALDDESRLKITRIIDDPLFSIQAEINIYGPGVLSIALFSEGEMSGFIIRSGKLYETMKSVFEFVWKNIN